MTNLARRRAFAAVAADGAAGDDGAARGGGAALDAAVMGVAVVLPPDALAAGVQALPEALEDEQPKAGDTCGVILAGGTGERFSARAFPKVSCGACGRLSRGSFTGVSSDPGDTPKQFVDLCGRPLLAWSLLAFDAAPSVGRIVLVCADAYRDWIEDTVLSREILTTPVSFATGGATRQESSLSGLLEGGADFPLTAIHDAARPLILPERIEELIAHVRNNPHIAGVIPTEPLKDTVKEVMEGRVFSTPDRRRYRAVQTPQVFWTKQLLAAHLAARDTGFIATDDASLAERMDLEVQVLDNPDANLKVTYPEDLLCARALLEERLKGELREGSYA